MWTKADFDYETRWTRYYSKKPHRRLRYSESRFMDGSATITLAELKRDWGEWTVSEKMDFSHSFAKWGHDLPERVEILRFLIANGDHESCWWTIAQSVARELSVEESVQVIRRWCESSKVGRAANYYQAIALTSDPAAHAILEAGFRRTWNTPGLMDDADFMNWIAFDAIHCIQRMLEFGEDSERFSSAYIQLMGHPCEGVRDDTRRWLSEWFA